MEAQLRIDLLRIQGYGVTVNMWPDDWSVAVVLWRDGNPVASGRALYGSLVDALEDAAAHIPEA